MRGNEENMEKGIIRKNSGDKLQLRIMLILTPLFCCLLTRANSGENLIQTFSRLPSVCGIIDIFLITAVMIIIYAFCNRVGATIIITVMFFYLFTLVNHLLIQFRGIPLIATDFKSVGTAIDVAGSYSPEVDKTGVIEAVAVVIWIVLVVSFKGYKGTGKKSRITVVAAALACVAVFYGLFFVADFTKEYKYSVLGVNPLKSYTRNGHVYSFAVSATSVRVEKPDGYSQNEAARIASLYNSDKKKTGAAVTSKTPNIIVIMNESFSEPAEHGAFKTSKKYMPFYNSLNRNTVKGTLHTSIYGGSTSDSEYEFLTGNTMKYFPVNAVPYYYIEDSIPTLETTLEDQGYGGLEAFHPGKPSSYDRVNVYPRLGFKKYFFKNDVKDPVYVGNFISDKSDYEYVISRYEKYRKTGSKKPYFMFNVTIQNHGEYNRSKKINDPIKIKSDGLEDTKAEIYLSMIRMSDDALKKLIAYFKNVKEPTVVVLYGDHQPHLEEFCTAVYKRSGIKEPALEQEERSYRVPFMIWANYDIEEKSGVNMSMNYFSSYLLDTLDMNMTGYSKFLLSMKDKLPIVSNTCYSDSGGRYFSWGEKSKYTEILEKYRILQYNYAIDNKNCIKNFFELM